MTVELNRYTPVLDPVIEVIEELSNAGKAELIVPYDREAIGLAVDVENMIYQLDRDVRIDVIANGKRTAVSRLPYREKDDILSIRFVDSEFSHDACKLYETCTITNSDGKRKHIAVSAADTNPYAHYDSAKRNPIVKFIKDAGLKLPDRDSKVTIRMRYHSMGRFIIETLYQDFEPTGKFYRHYEGIDGFNYPVSCKSEHNVSTNAFSFISDPLFWDSWSQYVSQTFAIIAGENTIEEVAARHNQSKERINEYFEKSKSSCYLIIDSSVSGHAFDEVFAQAKCPGKHRKFFISKPLKTLKFMANPDTLGSPRRKYAEQLVERYNEEYAKPNNRPIITVEQLCAKRTTPWLSFV